MNFTRWSQLNPQSKIDLLPNLGIRSWDDLDVDTKKLIWQHFQNSNWLKNDKQTYTAVFRFSDDHKANNYCKNLLAHGGPHYYERVQGGFSYTKDCCHEPAQRDAYSILLNEDQDVVYELLSYYAEVLKRETYNNQYSYFTNFFNDISDQFGLNIMLNDNGLVLKQEPKIDKEIYEPVLNYLADKKWKDVSRDLGDAFKDYLKNTPEAYSSCVTHAISGLQAFLQIIVNNQTGKGDIAGLVKEAINKGLIPNDPFSNKVFKDIVSILMQERQEKGDPHPKAEYANEKSARLVLNLVMIFMQHSMQA